MVAADLPTPRADTPHTEITNLITVCVSPCRHSQEASVPLCWQLKGVPGCPLVPVLLVAFLLSFAFFSLVVLWLGAASVATLCSDSCRTHMPGSSVWFFLGFFSVVWVKRDLPGRHLSCGSAHCSRLGSKVLLSLLTIHNSIYSALMAAES